MPDKSLPRRTSSAAAGPPQGKSGGARARRAANGSSAEQAGGDAEQQAQVLASRNAELCAARENERLRLACEMHDSLGAHLTALRLAIARLEPSPAAGSERNTAWEHTQQALDALCEANRRLIDDLHGLAPHAGLLAPLSRWVAQFQAASGLPISLIYTADPRLTRLRREAATTLFRIAQEAVNNAAKHASATRLELRINTLADRLELTVSDDGNGFHATQRARRGHYGIAGMRERCKSWGGTLRIASRPGATTVCARLPWSTLLPQGDRPSHGAAR